MAHRDEDGVFDRAVPATSPASPAMPSIEIGGAPTVRLSYRGQGWDLFVLLLKNVLLTLVTLGIYGAWARTARRKYMWRNVDVQGHPLDFTGTGKELFIGFLKVAAGYVAVFVFPQVVVARASHGAGIALQVLGVLAILVLVPFAIYWSRRYLLSRSRWRDIRFGLDGTGTAFAKECLRGMLLTVVTLGFYGPVFSNRLYGMLIRNTRYGNRSFGYSGPDREAFFIGLKGLLLSVVTLGVYVFWYRAAVARFRMAHTHFDGATLRFDVTGGLYLKLVLINLLALLFTLGIALPWTLSYSLREILGRVALVGPIDFASITPKETAGAPAADPLAGALGVDMGI